MKIGLVSDSNSDIDFTYAEKNNIKIAPLNVYFNDEHHVEDENFDLDSYYKNFDDQDLFRVKTSQPSPGVFIEKYEELLNEGYEYIITIVISSGLSGTYNSARLASQNFMEENDITVNVIDSKSSSYGIGFLVEKAVELIGEEMDPESIVEKIKSHRENISTILSLPTLKYLRASGRISFPKFLIGRIFGLKPIVQVNEEGENDAVGTVRNLEKGNTKIIEMTKNTYPGLPTQYAIVHANAQTRADKIEELILAEQQDVRIRKIRTRSSISAHTGPGAIGLIAEF